MQNAIPVAPHWASNNIIYMYKQDTELIMKNKAIINFEVIVFINQQLVCHGKYLHCKYAKAWQLLYSWS